MTQFINKSVTRLGITGGREYTDKNRVYREIDEFRKTHPNITTIVVGDARGTDWAGREYAKEKRLKLDEKKADWSDMSEPCFKKKRADGSFYNALAGHKRNQVIVNNSDALLGFWNGKSTGTADCMKRGRDKKIEVKEVRVNY